MLRLCLFSESPAALHSFLEVDGMCASARTSISVELMERIEKSTKNIRARFASGYPEVTKTDFEELGKDLFDVAIHGPVLALVRRFVDKNKMVPLEILIESDPMLSWPWEFMFDHLTQRFLCREFNPISRSVFDSLDFCKESGPVPLKMLMLVALKPDDPEISVAEHEASIRSIFERYLPDGLVDLQIEHNVGPDRLQELLMQRNVDIFHFLGHAGYTSQNGGYLSFHLVDGKVQRVAADTVGRFLANRGVKLAFLNACETAIGTYDGRFTSSVAAELLARGVPAVIGTQFTMPESSALIFAAQVYTALTSGSCIEHAVKEGRLGIEGFLGADSYDWGIPVLYSRRQLIQLFEPVGSK